MDAITLQPGSTLTYEYADFDVCDEYTFSVKQQSAKGLGLAWKGGGGAGQGRITIPAKAASSGRKLVTDFHESESFVANGELPALVFPAPLIDTLAAGPLTYELNGNQSTLAIVGAKTVSVRVNGKATKIAALHLKDDADRELWIADGPWPLVLHVRGIDGEKDNHWLLKELADVTLGAGRKTPAKPKAARAAKAARTLEVDLTSPSPVSFEGKPRPFEQVIADEEIAAYSVHGGVVHYVSGRIEERSLKRIVGTKAVTVETRHGLMLHDSTGACLVSDTSPVLERLAPDGKRVPFGDLGRTIRLSAAADGFVNIVVSNGDAAMMVLRKPLEGEEWQTVTSASKYVDSIAAGDGIVVWSDSRKDVIEAIDAASGGPVRTLARGLKPKLDALSQLVVHGGSVYFLTRSYVEGSRIMRFRPDGSGAIEVFLELDSNGASLLSDGDFLYFTSGEHLSRIDATRGQGRVIGRFVGAELWNLKVDDRFVYGRRPSLIARVPKR